MCDCISFAARTGTHDASMDIRMRADAHMRVRACVDAVPLCALLDTHARAHTNVRVNVHVRMSMHVHVHVPLNIGAQCHLRSCMGVYTRTRLHIWPLVRLR
jgi:hypothetical protein